MKVWVGMVLAAAVAEPASAAGKPPASESGYVARPGADDYRAAYGSIVKPGTFYRAVVACQVADDGAMTACKVIRETPPGSGFGAALLSLAPKYKRKPPGPRDPREVAVVDEWLQVDTAPNWLRRPTPEQLLAVFPTEAFRRGQDGRAVINCIVTTQGALTDCVTLEDYPAGAGFGGAAIALTPQFLMKPATRGGVAVPSLVTLPISFVTNGPGETFGSKKVVNAALPWAEAPSFAEVAAAYPAKARAEKRGGRATLSCDMTEAGRLSRCDVATSEPKGYGFDTAAKALAKHFALAVTSDSDRKATRQIEVHLPITFDPEMLTSTHPVIGKPTWAGLPKGEQLTAAFKDIKATGASRAVLNCAVRVGGYLEDCGVESETPAGSGVGAAALTLTPTFRLTSWTAEGLPVIGGRVSIPIRYEGAAAAAAPPK